MRVFVAGATGAIGRFLVPQLVAGGHEVVAAGRRPERAEAMRAAGAEVVGCDVLDPESTHRAVAESRADAVVHQATAVPAAINPRRMARQFEMTDRLRTEGTRNLVDAARRTGARVLAQSIAFAYAPAGDAIKSEDAPLNVDAPGQFRGPARAIAELERLTTDAGGAVLRYGFFYGPGTSYAPDGAQAELVRRRRFPVVGEGGGIFSYIHLEDAASATVAAVDTDARGVFNVVDDDPAPVREWLPEYARLLGAPPPRRVPKLVARLAAGAYGTQFMTELRGASNQKAKRELGWSPAHPSWRGRLADG